MEVSNLLGRGVKDSIALPNSIKRKTSGKICIAYIPEKLELEEKLAQTPPTFDSFLDHWYYLLGLLVELPIKSRDLVNSEGFVVINSEAINKHIKGASKILDYLWLNGILDRTNYTPGEKSRGYKYSSNYKGRYKEVKYRNNPYKPRKNRNTIKYHPLIESLDGFNSLIEFDEENALQWIAKQPERYRNRKGKICTFDRDRERIVVRRYSEGIFAKCSFPDDFGDKRLYPQWAICRGGYRHFLKFHGESFSQLDFSGSQLFLSRVLFAPDFYTNTSTGDKVCYWNLSQKVKNSTPEPINELVKTNNSNSTPPPHFTHTTYTASSYMFGKSSTTAMNTDVRKYIELVDNNQFYKFMVSELRKQQGYEDIKKPKAKRLIFTVLNSDTSKKNYYRDYTVPYKLWKTYFPTVIEYFESLKTKDHRNLNRTLSNIEAILVLERIVPRFIKEFPGIPIFPVHDCVMCPNSYMKRLELIVKEETEIFIGTKPPYKIEELRPENVCNLIPVK
ncbi:hypothetical protein [uncultured Sunxiuqinia sp.]|uniref:hypothetical protein n=1 Tax=uncultured Sunxiuqinia sp. TaxID=1573825 RepID=UPI0026139100|nr:hypothetical protein [uncultured Sunxiuqinia sp.]